MQRIAELEKELAVAEERKNGLESQLHHLSETVDDLRKRLDQSEGRVTALLSVNALNIYGNVCLAATNLRPHFS